MREFQFHVLVVNHWGHLCELRLEHTVSYISYATTSVATTVILYCSLAIKLFV
jgi:hypothetical protein